MPLVLAEFIPGQNPDPVLGHGRPDVIGEDPHHFVDEFPRSGEQGVEQFAGHQTGVRRHCHTGGHAALQAGDAHHEELVEVAAENG